MAAQVVWSETAITDLCAIAAYIARDSPTYSAALIERIFYAVESLARFPTMGRVVPEYAREELRQVIVRPYRIVYRAGSAAIQIVTVVHGARSLPPGRDASR
ncbi:MAG: type II toxin-antitoxin system RelE/ParE family toxin [Phycisphaerae bacterium]